jgi:hypothetical protein
MTPRQQPTRRVEQTVFSIQSSETRMVELHRPHDDARVGRSILLGTNEFATPA